MYNGRWNDDMMDGGGWWWMMMVIFVVALIGFAVVRRPRQTVHPSAPGAQAILAERLARGEIEADEYRSRLEALNHRSDS